MTYNPIWKEYSYSFQDHDDPKLRQLAINYAKEAMSKDVAELCQLGISVTVRVRMNECLSRGIYESGEFYTTRTVDYVVELLDSEPTLLSEYTNEQHN